MAIIEIRNLTKKFNGGFTAVDGITLSINEGEIFGLLGPNGAGKTTTISMLATILPPTSGSAVLCGHDCAKETDAVRKCIGIVFQDPSLDDELTGRENMDFHGRLYGMPDELRKSRINELLKLVELESFADKQTKTYSGGMKRRLEIARGLMHHPKVLFLDEPTLGLDPQTRRKLWDYIENVNKGEKVTIILTTHYMDEADELCGRIAIVDHGKIIALDTPEGHKKSLGGDVAVVECSDPEKLASLLRKAKLAKRAEAQDGKVTATVENGAESVPKITALAEKNNIIVKSVTVKRPNLEDVFLHHTGRAIRDEEAGDKERMKAVHGHWRR
ncbi:putative ABC transporter ATP-binding protein [uncultured archaeon]|nr:putative ABC transporter ATP-binding protein [uncultured archaeon]